ncbi:putative lipid-transfer protein DIR1 [Elaeis guineensis]|uniref:Lipid-transfer protein DIR1 n=1 Tax=Elaeis guineensis var. tenera TaxID=51953 RepID=A0A1D5AIW1_ELAGV|nr:putative lipid-transfer protein DIR1 [Elaeis guineensis]AOC88988.1 type 6 nonspecific lipid transfer protein LTP601 [Elaeis guineensis]
MESLQKLVMVMLVLSITLGCGEITVSRADGLCNMTMDGFNACKPAATGPEPTEPSKECCEALANADLPCLCSYRHSVLLPSLGIDPDLAMQLPEKCNLTLPAEC